MAELMTTSADRSILMDAHDLQAAGIPRALAYQLLNRADMPVISIGRRKFMVKAKFEKWLDEHSGGPVSE